jgi:membrane-bound serine protease (ClpP class)
MGVALAVLLLLAGAALAAAAPAGAPDAPRRGEVVVLRVASIIHPIASAFIKDALAQADAAGAAAVVLELDTPGGLLTSTREITTALLGARTPVIVYVAPSGAQAASAGFFILMAADVAAMAPGTNTGAAHPVGPQGEDIEGTMGKKVEQDTAAYVRALAARHGRNAKLAEAAVRESRSFTAEEAKAAGLADLVVDGLPQLLRQVDGRVVRRGNARVRLATAGAPVREIRLSPLREVLSRIAHPDIAYLLLTLGTLGLMFELMHPGAIFPGVVGGICLVLAFFALSVLPVTAAGVSLLLLAAVFFIAEIKVTSYGLLTVAGAFSLVLGSLLLFEGSEPALRVSIELIAIFAVFAVAVTGLLVALALRARRNPVRTGQEGMIGERGIALTALVPGASGGKVFVHGEYWNAVAAEPVAVGDEVEVVAIDSFTLRVRPRTTHGPAGAFPQ